MEKGPGQARWAGAALVLSLALGAGFALTCVEAVRAWSAPPDPAAHPLKTYYKAVSYPLEDAILRGIEPNVLIYMDTMSGMVVSMKGQIPIFKDNDDWMKTNYPAMRDADFRANLLLQNTFGIGNRPVSHGTMADQTARLSNNNLTLPYVSLFPGVEDADNRFNYMGKDVDDANNIIGNQDCYYSSDPNKPYFLTFRNSEWANWNGQNSPPSSMPNELRKYLPGGPSYGWPVSHDLAEAHLIPNDSKMYKVKLVLWRLLSPDDSSKQMLSRMRLGLATTFSDREYPTGSGRSATISYAPFRYDSPTRIHNIYGGPGPNTERNVFMAYHGNSNGSGPRTQKWTAFPGGVAVDTNTTGAGVLASTSQTLSASVILYGGTSSIYNSLTNGPRHASRSILRVPFDFMYSQGGNGEYRPTASAITFREYIDGVMQVNQNNSVALLNRFVNDELYTTNTIAPVEQQIYGGNRFISGGNNQNVLNGQRALAYATGAEGFRTLHEGYTNTAGVPLRRVRNSEGLMTGTALGDALSFFSPPTGALSYAAGSSNGDGDTRGYFPVTGSCQPNWIIYFTTGSEAQPGWSHTEENSMMKALHDIYMNSKQMRGRQWDGANWVEQTFDMDNPIRIIVVGLITTQGMESDGNPYAVDSPADTPAKRVRKAVRRMAHAGQPHEDGTPDTSVEPIFADNVPDLIRNLHETLVNIQTERITGGAPTLQPMHEEDPEGDRILFGASYTVNMKRQWQGGFAKYKIPRGQEGSVLVWDARTIIANQAQSNTRRVYTVDAPMNQTLSPPAQPVLLTSLSDSQFQSLLGLPDPYISPDDPNPAAKEVEWRAHLADFKTWLVKYPHEDGILGDMEHSNYVIVGDGKFRSFKNGQEFTVSRQKVIYFQTNRGVLHCLDYETGQELWAFIPPHILRRVWQQRFLEIPGGGSTPIAGDGSSTMFSRPLVLLDGPLVAMDRIDDADAPSVSDLKTYLIGASGWGGAGIYVMDITLPENPILGTGAKPFFLWAVDNARYGAAEPNGIGDSTTPDPTVHFWGNAAHSDFQFAGRLGLTLHAPIPWNGAKYVVSEGSIPAGTRRHHSGFLLPGGMGLWGRGDKNQGKALLVNNNFEAGSALFNLNAKTHIYAPPNLKIPINEKNYKLGMFISPMYVLDSDKDGLDDEYFAADSDGNIVVGNLLQGNQHDPTYTDVRFSLKNFFQLRTIVDSFTPGVAAGQPIAIPNGFAMGGKGMGANRDRWLFGGSANLVGPDGVEVSNGQQYIFALRLNRLDLTPFTDPSESVTTGALARLKYMKTTPSILPLWGGEEMGSQNGVPPDARGWRLMLRPKVVHPTIPTDAEYVTAAPFLYNGSLFVATFTPRTWQPGDQERCLDIGDAKLYALDPQTGASKWKSGQEQAYVLSNIKIMGISGSRGHLFLGVKALKPGALSSFSQHEELSNFITHVDGSVVEIVTPKGGDTQPNLEPIVPHLQYWREMIR
jgi:outer membrane protein assembly factor BamB